MGRKNENNGEEVRVAVRNSDSFGSRRMELEIDEYEREDFARIKWVKTKRKTHQAYSEKLRADFGDRSPSIFSEYEDADIMF